MVRSVLRITLVASVLGLSLGLPAVASAHNRAHLILPDGACIIVGSEKSVILPDGTELDLRPETTDGDEIGTSFAATEGKSAIEKLACP